MPSLDFAFSGTIFARKKGYLVIWGIRLEKIQSNNGAENPLLTGDWTGKNQLPLSKLILMNGVTEDEDFEKLNDFIVIIPYV
jgi:hypothetical protein